jgi:hypothetical protein
MMFREQEYESIIILSSAEKSCRVCGRRFFVILHTITIHPVYYAFHTSQHPFKLNTPYIRARKPGAKQAPVHEIPFVIENINAARA